MIQLYRNNGRQEKNREDSAQKRFWQFSQMNVNKWAGLITSHHTHTHTNNCIAFTRRAKASSDKDRRRKRWWWRWRLFLHNISYVTYAIIIITGHSHGKKVIVSCGNILQEQKSHSTTSVVAPSELLFFLSSSSLPGRRKEWNVTFALLFRHGEYYYVFYARWNGILHGGAAACMHACMTTLSCRKWSYFFSTFCYTT